MKRDEPSLTSPDPRAEPFAARLHFLPRFIRPLQGGVVRVFRRYFERAPGWVLLTTTGRRTGLPREVLADGQDLARALPAAMTRFERFAGCGHPVYEDDEERCFATIREFLK